ncbi:unnamed protein product [Penicillium salamii]|nr:unnamed protein product [Penicillium salamii]CAG7987003.1 unnamed protein product [Penicillium salamii]
MKKLEMVLQEKDDSETIIRRTGDTLRFIRYHRTAIESTPLQVYCSPLIFSPAESFTRTCYQKERPN